MTDTCTCRSHARRLVLYHPGHPEQILELWGAADKFGWSHDPGRRTLTVELSPERRFCDIASLSDFVRGLVPESYEAMRALWLGNGDPLPGEHALSRAPLLRDLAPLASSPLPVILRNRAIETWFQPIRRADTLDSWGYECLMRARLPDGRRVGPEQVIAWARQEHMLFMLDRICRETHVQHAAAAGAPSQVRFFINFLPTVIYDPSVCLRSTLQAVERAGLEPERIVFEVVETEKIPDRAHLRHILDFYRDKGFCIALDDLGAGHSDLVLLGDLAPDFIKVERELIAKSAESSIHRAICRSIVEIARSEGKMVLAEGVETQQEWDFVQTLRVDLVQGFLFGRPSQDLSFSPVL